MAKVGIFGLGLVGTALATRLLAAGHAVAGHDPRPERGEALSALGGAPVEPDETWQAPLVLSAVFDTDQLAALIEAAPCCDDTVLVSLSTCDPDRMDGLAAKAAAKGIALIEAPVSGTSKSVAEGTALFLLAGEDAVIDRFEAVRPTLSPNAVRVGRIGNGNRTKLAINLVLGLNRAAIAEGLVFAEAIGLDPGTFLSVAQSSAAASAVMDGKGQAMVARNWNPLGRLTQSQKDFRLILETARRADLAALPFAGTYLDLISESIGAGEGDLDNAAVLLAIERRARSTA